MSNVPVSSAYWTISERVHRVLTAGKRVGQRAEVGVAETSTDPQGLSSANTRPSACHQGKWNCGCPPELPA
jgi:hypothetical protein